MSPAMNYIVLRQSDWRAAKSHTSWLEAKTEAERLARKEKDTFHVVQIVASCKVTEIPVQWYDMEGKPTN